MYTKRLSLIGWRLLGRLYFALSNDRAYQKLATKGDREQTIKPLKPMATKAQNFVK